MRGGREVWKAARATAAHALLLTFTILLVLKLHTFSFSWWFVFSPLLLFHAVVYRGRVSIPAPSHLDVIPWDPFHSIVAMPLLIAFELLLCVYLESSYVDQVAAVKLEIVFLPIFLFETIIIIENFRMCWPLILLEIKMSCLHEEFASDLREWDKDVRFQLYINFVTTFAMVFILGATVFLVQMIIGNIDKATFWAPYLIISFGQFCAHHVFLCDMRTRFRKAREGSSSSKTAGYLDQTSTSVVQVEEEKKVVRLCIGGHVAIVLILGFQIVLCMYMQGTPARAREIPIPIIFSPLLLLQGVGVLFSTSRLVERIALLLPHSEVGDGRFLTLSSGACDFLACISHGSRFLGWWSVDDGSREEEAQRFYECKSGCNTFCRSPDVVKKMPKKDLVEEVCTLQAAIKEQIQLTESCQREYERLQNVKVLCTICFQRNIGVVLLPCRHRILCSMCGKKCSKCPICRISIAEWVSSYCV